MNPVTGHEGLEREQRYSSTLSLTSALDEVRQAPCTCPDVCRKSLLPSGFNLRTVQVAASRYIDRAIPDHK
jgi:hypothetical protein